MEYKTERLTKNALEELTTLHNESFGTHNSPDYVIPKYSTEILGSFPLGYFATTESGKKVSFVGFFPSNFSYSGKLVKASQAGDVMTHPDHRGKKLFVTLAQQCFETAASEHFAFVFGFANSQAYPGWIKLGWKFTGKWNTAIIGSKIPEQARYLNKIAFFKNILSSRLKKYEVPFDEQSWKPAATNGVNGYVIKNSAFFDYKKQYSSAAILSYKGFLVHAKYSGYILVGDVSYFPENEFPRFISAMQQLAHRVLAPKIVFQFSKNHWLFSYFANNPAVSVKEDTAAGGIGYKIFNNEAAIDVESIMHTVSDADFF